MSDAFTDTRPANCRFRLQSEGKPYPRSACESCGATIMTGLGTACRKGAKLDAPIDTYKEPVEIHQTEPVEHDDFVKKAVAAAMVLLEASWRATLRKERDARLVEVRLKEKYKQEAADLRARLEKLQGSL